MAVPRGKHTKRRRNNSRMHLFLKEPNFIVCSKCGAKTKPHIVCPSCGFYRGKEVINVLEKLDKKAKKAKEQEIATKEKEGGKKTKPLDMKSMSKK